MRCLSAIACSLHSVRASILIAASAILALLSAGALNANAQTAHFSGAVATLGGGFYQPLGVAVDGSGNVYVADTQNSAVKEIPAGCASSSCVTTLGGGFSYPQGVAVDGSGNVYVADTENIAVKKMPAGCASSSCVTTLGGGFNWPEGVAVDGSGNVYVGDQGSGVYEMPAGCASSSCVTTLGGGFFHPEGVAVDGSGNVYVADYGHNAVKEMPAGCASSSCVTTLDGGFYQPEGVAVDGSGNVYVSQTGYTGVLYEMPAGCASPSCVTTLGGGFSNPYLGVAVNGSGNVYVADYGNNAVKEIMTASGNFGSVNVGSTSANPLTFYFTFDTDETLGPTAVLTQGAPNLDFNAAATQESNACKGITAYNAGDTCTVDVTFKPTKAGTRYGAVELLNAGGSTIATAYVYGTGQGPQVVFSPASQSTLGSGFNDPTGVAVDSSGNIFVADRYHSAVKEILAAGGYTTVNTLGSGFSYPAGVAVDGSGNVFVTDYGHWALKEILAVGGSIPATNPTIITLGSGFYQPEGVAVDGSGNLWVADSGNSIVKEILAAGGYTTVKTVLSGFSYPSGLAVDGSGNLFVADPDRSEVKEIVAAGGYTTVNILGGGFAFPWGVAVDAGGNVYVADVGRMAVYEMPAGCASSSCVTTLGGGFASPYSVAMDGSGNVYVAETGNNVVKEINRATPPSLAFATTLVGQTSTDSPQTVTVSNDGNAALTFPLPSSGNNPSVATNFLWDSSSTCQQTHSSSSNAFSLAGGDSCTMAFDFKPTAAGAISGGAVLTDNNLNQSGGTQTIQLSGTGTATKAVLTTPTPGSTLSGTSATFSWSAGGVTYYEFQLGTTGPGSSNVYNPSGTTTTSLSTPLITGLPAYGVTLYARLKSWINGAWQYNDYTYMESGTPVKAALTSPAPGSTLTGTSVTFNWTAGGGVTKYELQLGYTGPGSSNVYNASGTTTNSLTTGAITVPAYGVTLYARLKSYINGAWQYNDYTYMESGTPVKAVLTTPTPGSTLTGTSITFNWTAGGGVTKYEFQLGIIGHGSTSVYNASGTTTNSLTTGAITVPANGVTLYARLYSYINGAWQYNDYTYTESGTPTKAALTAPTPGSTLTGTSATFTWTAGGGVTKYEFELGTTGHGSSNVYNAAGTSTTALTTPLITGIPANGVTLYARLYSYINGAWQYNDYTYTESGTPVKAVLTSPTPGITLTGSSATFTWTAGGGVTKYLFELGTTGHGSSNVYNAAGTSTTALTTGVVSGIPTTGATLYARLYSYINGAWQYNDYTYTEQ